MNPSAIRRLLLPLTGLLALNLTVTSARADSSDYEVREFKGAPTAQQLIEALDPEADVPMRGLKPVDEPLKPKAVALQVPFEFDSYRLTGEAKAIVERLGTALQSQQLRSHAFVIEGHTDAIGAEPYNQRLSEQRARVVKQYLIDAYGIEPGRLRAIGKGERDLLDKADPSSARNRRVQIVLGNP